MLSIVICVIEACKMTLPSSCCYSFFYPLYFVSSQERPWRHWACLNTAKRIMCASILGYLFEHMRKCAYVTIPERFLWNMQRHHGRFKVTHSLVTRSVDLHLRSKFKIAFVMLSIIVVKFSKPPVFSIHFVWIHLLKKEHHVTCSVESQKIWIVYCQAVRCQCLKTIMYHPQVYIGPEFDRADHLTLCLIILTYYYVTQYNNRRYILSTFEKIEILALYNKI